VLHGGVSVNPQMMGLRGGADVVVATPGRLLDLLERNALRLGAVEALVLDEADRLLDLGFAAERERVLAAAAGRSDRTCCSPPPSRPRCRPWPTLGCCATRCGSRPPRRKTAEAGHRAACAIAVDPVAPHRAAAATWRKEGRLARRAGVRRHPACGRPSVARKLHDRGLFAAPLHGDMSQGQRTERLALLKDGGFDLLVTTDLAARGIDIPGLRGGRQLRPAALAQSTTCTASAAPVAPAKSGVAVSFVSASTEAALPPDREAAGHRAATRAVIAGFEPDRSGSGGVRLSRAPVASRASARARRTSCGRRRRRRKAVRRTAKAAKAKRTAESTARQRRTNGARTPPRRHSVHRVVDLVPRNAQVAQLFTHAQMRRMRRIAVERGLAVELAVQHHVAGVAHAARIGTHFQVQQPRDLPAQRFATCA
jgi:ATP-dependent RNA helicase RhlE